MTTYRLWVVVVVLAVLTVLAVISEIIDKRNRGKR